MLTANLHEPSDSLRFKLYSASNLSQDRTFVMTQADGAQKRKLYESYNGDDTLLWIKLHMHTGWSLSLGPDSIKLKDEQDDAG